MQRRKLLILGHRPGQSPRSSSAEDPGIVPQPSWNRQFVVPTVFKPFGWDNDLVLTTTTTEVAIARKEARAGVSVKPVWEWLLGAPKK
jgi:hypothetical protein